MTELPHGTVTLLFTDVEGSTQLQHRLGDSYQEVVAEHRRLLEQAFAAHEGVVVDRQTESFFVAFGRARQAVAAAADAQRALAEHRWPDGVQVKVRMGIHSGDPEVAGDRYVGLAVSRAARICACAHGGQVLLSSSARALLSDHEQTALPSLGPYRLKDFTEPETISQLVVDGLPSQFPPLRTDAAPSRRRRRLPLVVGIVVAVVAVAAVVAVLTGGSSGSLAGVPRGSVGRIDPKRAAFVQAFQVGGTPGAVAFGQGSVWTADEAGRTVTRLDPGSGHTEPVVPGVHPDSIAVAASGVWIGSRIEGLVVRLDPQLLDVTGQSRISARGSIASAPTGLAIGAGSVWAAANGSIVSRISAATGRIAAAPLTPDLGANCLAYGGGAVWVGGQGAAMEIDPHTGELAPQPVQTAGNAVAITVGSGSVWAVTNFPAGLVKIDLATKAVNTLSLGDGASGVAVGGGAVWVVNSLQHTVLRVDPAALRVTKTIKVGAKPTGVAFGDGSVWVSAA